MRLPKKLWNTEFQANALLNKKRLFTVLDLHKTLQQFRILDSPLSSEFRSSFQQSSYGFRQDRGVSLFEEIGVDRTCTQALIPMIFCSKLRKVIYNEANYKDFLTETG